MSPMEMFHAAVRDGLAGPDPNPGSQAGEHFMELAHDRGLELDSSINSYRCAINHAAMADLIVTAIRQTSEPWRIVDHQANGWATSALMNPAGSQLRRFLAVSHWGADRAVFETHSWYVLGEIAHYEMPLELVIAVIGPMIEGRRRSHWSKALFHPKGARLRFKLQKRSRVEGFAESWQVIQREEHDEIERRDWLQAMLDDHVLEESLFVVKVPVPPETAHIRELAKRQLERLQAITELPPKQLTTCDNPLHPCPFRCCCWSQPESKPEDGDYSYQELM